MLKQTPNLGSAVHVLQQQMAGSDAVCIVGQNSSGVADSYADGNVLQAPAGIISYEPDELMISLYAGSTIADINVALQTAHQRILIPEIGTIGGAIATRRNGLRGVQHQTLPNNVLRCSVIAADGSIFQSGGQVVKNVSGFDLVKLLVGSWGLLGLIVEVTMRTEPIPQASQWLYSSEPSAIEQVSNLYRPAAITHIDDVTYVLLEGNERDVREETSRLNGFETCEVPQLSISAQQAQIEGVSQGLPLSIEQEIRKQFDSGNKLNRHIATQRNLLT
jgi:glycolate oxidase FAD binding subunit